MSRRSVVPTPEDGGMADDYTDDEWTLAVADAPLAKLPKPDVALLHRHWMWANQQRERFYELLGTEKEEVSTLATRCAGHMLAWYGFLWSVIEAFRARGITFKGPFQSDIDSLSNDLRRVRNAVFHVPGTGEYYDKRIVAFVGRSDAVDLVRRVHRGFGRLFLTFMRAETPGE